jgi:hypothetical protein
MNTKKVTNYKQLKVGDYIHFKNKKEEGVFKIKSIKTSFFSDAVDINCSVGKLEALIVSGDIKYGYVSFSASKKTYYKQVK